MADAPDLLTSLRAGLLQIVAKAQELVGDLEAVENGIKALRTHAQGGAVPQARSPGAVQPAPSPVQRQLPVDDVGNERERAALEPDPSAARAVPEGARQQELSEPAAHPLLDQLQLPAAAEADPKHAEEPVGPVASDHAMADQQADGDAEVHGGDGEEGETVGTEVVEEVEESEEEAAPTAARYLFVERPDPGKSLGSADL